jgi:hypothetical protein
MYLPSAVTRPPEIDAAVSEVVSFFAPDVVHIRYDIARDWSGDWAIFFRVLLSDDASKTRLRELASRVAWRLEQRLDLPSIRSFPLLQFQERVRTGGSSGTGLGVAVAICR